MKKYIDQVVRIMAINRRRHKIWEKIREDRVLKLVNIPKEVGTEEEFRDAFLNDPRIKRVKMLSDDSELVPAVRLHFKDYQKVLKSTTADHIKWMVTL